ncbi:MAG: hypothetical protein V3W37_07700, partial [Candidatus Binatia bacterium]
FRVNIKKASDYYHTLTAIQREGGWNKRQLRKLYRARRRWNLRRLNLDKNFWYRGNVSGFVKKSSLNSTPFDPSKSLEDYFHTPGDPDDPVRHYTGDEHDKREGRAYPTRRVRQAYTHLLPPLPVCPAGEIFENQVKAKSYLYSINQLIVRGGWAHKERASLYTMRDKWQARAEGNDKLFIIRGNRVGRPTNLERRVAGGLKLKRRERKSRKVA